MTDPSPSSSPSPDVDLAAARDRIGATVSAIGRTDDDIAAAARSRWDSRAKPPGSLGQIESIGVALATIAGTVPPPPITAPNMADTTGMPPYWMRSMISCQPREWRMVPSASRCLCSARSRPEQ